MNYLKHAFSARTACLLAILFAPAFYGACQTSSDEVRTVALAEPSFSDTGAPSNHAAAPVSSDPAQHVPDLAPMQRNLPEGQPHLIAGRLWISGQSNFIFQAHGPFHSPYSGTNSFQSNTDQVALSRVMTLYTAFRIGKYTEFLFAPEEAGGSGLSQALGIAGFMNLDVVRNPSLGQNVYYSRYQLHQTIALSDSTTESQPGPFSLSRQLPSRRLELRMGKISTVDFFDVNSVGSDSHLQFTNWALANNGAYDYAADTRGYTTGAIVEYQSPSWGARFGELLMPTVANGLNLDYNLRRSRSENLELDLRPHLFAFGATTIRPLAYLNHANMGSYRQSINQFLAGTVTTPDVTLTRKPGTMKQGFGLNVEQMLPEGFRLFARTGWNEGHHETFAYTEINNTLALGADMTGDRWHRPADKVGAAFATNGLSRDHRDYLAYGGLGFILGDGKLNYGRELDQETYYTAHLFRGFYSSLQLSVIHNPGYNQDRGMVIAPGARMHIDF